MFVDTHAHLSYPEFAADLDDVLARATASRVHHVISIATSLDEARRVIEIAEKFPQVSGSVGLHPGKVPEVRLCETEQLRELAAHPKIVAIGETGLDYYREARDQPALQRQQKDLFWSHLDLARELSLPVVIHNRSAERDILEILRAHAQKLSEQDHPWGVMHCFAGDLKFARDCLELGLFISYTGILTFKNARTLQDVAAEVPLDRVMLETDAPYLAPVPYRGKRNEPAHVPHIAAVLAELKRVTVDEVAAQTSANAERLFGIAAG